MESALSSHDYPAYAEHISNKTQKPLGWGNRAAIIVVDVGLPYFSAASLVSLLDSSCGTAAALPDKVRALITAARAGGCPVIWANTLFTNTHLRDAGLWKQKMSADILGVFNEKDADRQHLGYLENLAPQRGPTEGASTTAAGLPVADLLVQKKFASAFFGTNLATQLQVLGVDTLVFCGARTGDGIRQSALDAQGLGFRGIADMGRPPNKIVGEACADTCKQTHLGNLYDIHAKIGDVVTAKDAEDRLRRGWDQATMPLRQGYIST